MGSGVLESFANLCLGKARAGVARIDQDSVPVPAEHQGAELSPGGLPRCDADDGELGAPRNLQFLPAGGTLPRFVGGVGSLRDDPFAVVLSGDLEKSLTVSFDVVRESDETHPRAKYREQGFAFSQRQLSQVAAGSPDEVEGVEHHGNFVAHLADGAAVRLGKAAL